MTEDCSDPSVRLAYVRYLLETQNNKQAVVKWKVDAVHIPLHRNSFEKKRQPNDEFELFKSYVNNYSVPKGRTVRGWKNCLPETIRPIRNPDKLKGNPTADVFTITTKSVNSHL